jgi:polysaccharide pyruvyl transferase WcaK-like protein
MGAAPDNGNMGVSAMATSLVHLVHGTNPDARIYFFIGHRSDQTQRVEYRGSWLEIGVLNFRRSPASKPGQHVAWLLFLALVSRFTPFAALRRRIVNSNHHLRVLSGSDFVGDIRGGDSFSDIYGFSSFIQGTIPSLIALLLGKRLVLLPQTYGPYRSRAARRVAHFVLRRAAAVFARDLAGLEYVKKLAAPAPGRLVQFCPDVAFALEPIEVERPDIVPPLPKPGDAPVVGLNVSGLLYNGGFTRDNMFGLKFDYREFVLALAERLLAETNARLLLVPHTFAPKGDVESDPEACELVERAVGAVRPGRVHRVARQYDAMRIKAIIGTCDFFIGSRMHACVAAVSQGVPTIGLAYSPKFQGLFGSIGVGDLVVDARETGFAPAMETILRRYQEREVLKPRVAAAAARARSLLEGTFSRIMGGAAETL